MIDLSTMFTLFARKEDKEKLNETEYLKDRLDNGGEKNDRDDLILEHVSLVEYIAKLIKEELGWKGEEVEGTYQG